MSVSALASNGYTAYGGSSIGNAGKSIDTSKIPYYYNGTYDLAWRVDLYVSGKDDGTIDKSTDTISRGSMKNANDYLRYVSSIIYTNVDLSCSDVYLQTNETDYKRNYGLRTLLETYDNGGHVNGIAYNLPTAEKLYSDKKVSGDGSVYIKQGTTNGLPSSLAGCDKATLHTVAESDEFMINVTNNISERMGSNNFFSKILSSVSSQVLSEVEKLVPKNATAMQKEEALKTLMPDSVYQGVKPLVEWAVTITPMMCWRASSSRPDSFWAFNDEYGTMTIIMPSSTGKEAVLIMDAYYSATYNQVTTGNAGANSIWFSDYFQDAIDKADGYIPADTIEQYWKDGILRRWYIVASTNTNILSRLW